ncbi:MAG TPA: MFS transporter [Spirochaetes bacterium]|nr:MFS transporter [Spirochaetota bacterium]
MRSFSKNEQRILFFTNAGHFFAHTFILIFPSLVAPLSAELSLPFEEVLKISFLMFLFYGLGSLPSGFLSDIISPRLSLTVYYLGIGISGIFVYLSGSRAQLLISLTALGIFLSIYHPVAMGLISKTIKNRGLALGINGAFGSIGIASAPFLAGLITYLFGWRYVYLLLSVVSVLFGLFINIINFEIKYIKKDNNFSDLEEKKYTKLGYFLILCISFLLAGFVYRGQTLILPTYFEQRAPVLYNLVKSISFIKLEGTKTLSATILTSLVYVVSIAGQIVGGKIADKYDLRYSYFLFFACALPFLFMMYFFRNIPLLIVSMFFIMLTIGMQPIENSIIAKFTPSKWRNTGYAIKFTLGFGVSSFVIYPVGFFQTHYSLAAVFLLFSLVTAVLVLNCFILILATRGITLKN